MVAQQPRAVQVDFGHEQRHRTPRGDGPRLVQLGPRPVRVPQHKPQPGAGEEAADDTLLCPPRRRPVRAASTWRWAFTFVIWIGYLQWMKFNGFNPPNDPVLEPIKSIRLMDAILDLSDPQYPKEPEWPEAEFIVGNPPFLGDKVMRGGLGDKYVEQLRTMYAGRIPGGADLCCYWFEKARAQIKAGHTIRAGLLGTQNVRGGASRKALDRIAETGSIFFGVSDRNWVLDGAMVHISMVGFDSGIENAKTLDGMTVATINPNLTGSVDITKAKRLQENAAIGFLGSCKGGSFDITESEAIRLVTASGNPHGRPNSDLLRPVVNSRDLLGRSEGRWIIDTGNLTLAEAALYTDPFAIVEARVKPTREVNRDKWLRENWWRPQRMRPEMQEAIGPLHRFCVTPTTSKHRIFSFLEPPDSS